MNPALVTFSLLSSMAAECTTNLEKIITIYRFPNLHTLSRYSGRLATMSKCVPNMSV